MFYKKSVFENVTKLIGKHLYQTESHYERVALKYLVKGHIPPEHDYVPECSLGVINDSFHSNEFCFALGMNGFIEFLTNQLNHGDVFLIFSLGLENLK